MAELITPIAERRGRVAALVDEFGETDWVDLDERVNRLVNGLRDLGLQAGDTFAVLSGNRREAFEAHLAAGHGAWVVVPVNWHWTADELAYVINDSGARALIVDGRYAAVAVDAARALTGCPLRIVIDAKTLDGPVPEGFLRYEEVLAGADPAEPPEQGSGGPMFYTSGTTGFPKGVRGTLNRTGSPPAVMQLLAAAITGGFGIPQDGVTLLEGPLYHSAQWAFPFAPLAGGSTVVMRHQFDPAELLELIDRYQVTNLHLVPTQFIRLLKLPEEVRGAFDGSSLEVAVHGAAPCPIEVKRQMLAWWGALVSESSPSGEDSNVKRSLSSRAERGETEGSAGRPEGHTDIVEYYGGTEGGFLSVITGDEWREHEGSLGRASGMVDLLLVKEDGSPAGPNEPGQIYFRSRIGADFEYHNAPEKTASAHLEPGVGTLGDIGYLDDDGYLYMSDRKIDMIISGGVNIYPAEIEGVLVTHPAVADAAVFGIPDDEMGEQVKAAVELVEGHAPTDDLARDLIAHVREHLAGYKAPKTIDLEDELPRHPTGKLYKRLLRDPYWEGAGRSI